MIDTVSLHIAIEPPPEVTERIPEPFLWHGMTFAPYYTPKGFIRTYTGRFKNLFLTFNDTGLYLGNSWHKFYHGNNWNDYTFSQIKSTYEALNDHFNGLIQDASIRRLDYGLNIPANPTDVFENWAYLRTKEPQTMRYKGKPYGQKFYGTEYNFKGYDKTAQTKLQDFITLPQQITRLEKSVFRMRNITHRKQNRIPVYTARDLTRRDVIQQLANDFLTTYKQIERMEKINYRELAPNQIKIVAVMQNKDAREVLRATNNRTYKRYLKEYRQIIKQQKPNNFLQDKIFEKTEYLINA